MYKVRFEYFFIKLLREFESYIQIYLIFSRKFFLIKIKKMICYFIKYNLLMIMILLKNNIYDNLKFLIISIIFFFFLTVIEIFNQ